MASHSPRILITGANRGIGLEVARQLARAGEAVLLTARRASDAREAAAALHAQGLAVEAHALDVSDPKSLDALADTLTRDGVRLKALINNAGLLLDGFDAEVARRTVDVNFFGPMRVTDRLLPLLTAPGRIVMVSSGMGELSHLPPKLRAKFDPPPPRPQLIALMESFVADAARPRREWPSSAYSVSKVGLNALTRVYAEELRERRILVNAACPGWVRTRMGGQSAPRSVATGAAGVVFAATLPENGPTGGFFRDGRPIPW